MKYKISLKAARINAGMRQSDVARALNVSTESIANWERGKRSPKTTTLVRLCQLYKIPMDHIFLPS